MVTGIHPVVQEFIDFRLIQQTKLFNRELKIKEFNHLIESTKQEAIKESGLSQKEFLKQLSYA